MNDNAPESERWVPVEAVGSLGKTDAVSPALSAARREAEAVIAKHFPAKP